ncbi:MAG: hypothetical protein KGN02_06705 [bacterium]|nr:hypothetical protein [bacterium]
MHSYREESARLDDALFALIEGWHRGGHDVVDDEFDTLALRVFAYQLRYNEPYARYCASLGVTLDRPPSSWHGIPPLPSAAFKEATIATFDPARAELVFETSGTTQGVGGKHYMERAALYDAALIAGFDRLMLPDHQRLRYFNLVPARAERPQSSLGYMMAQVSAARANGAGFYLRGDALLMDPFLADLSVAIERRTPVCIAATAFALVHLLDAMRERDLFVALPTGSRIMETGGFKGRSRVVERDQLYDELCECFGMPRDAIVAEYGMTELTSQWYDDVLVAKRPDDGVRYKVAPPWLRARVVGPDGTTLPDGTVGAIVHVDLANRSSCLAIQTEDLGVRFERGLVLIGREAGASLRGCSLDAEDLVRR